MKLGISHSCPAQAEIALFAKLTRLPNLLLWPMDAADAAPGR